MIEKVHEDVIYLLLNSMLYNMFLKFCYLLLVLKIFHLAVSILCLVVYTTSVHDSVCYPNSPDCLLGKRGKKEFFYKLRMRKRSYVIIQEYLKHHLSPEFPILPPGCSSELWISCMMPEGVLRPILRFRMSCVHWVELWFVSNSQILERNIRTRHNASYGDLFVKKALSLDLQIIWLLTCTPICPFLYLATKLQPFK